MKKKLNYDEFIEELGKAVAIEVDEQYVIYPPHDDDGELMFFEDENQEEPYFTITDEWDLFIEDGIFIACLMDPSEHHEIRRLGNMDVSTVWSTPSEVYAEKGGDNCPECGSVRLEGVSSLDHCGNIIYQESRCIECGFGFMEKYRLSGFEAVE